MTRSVKPPLASKNALSKQKPKLLPHNQLFGQWGETQAQVFLRRLGYRCLDRNLRICHSELDLVMLDPVTQELVIVEVKTRGLGSERAGHASLAVRGRKWLALERAGIQLLAKYCQVTGLRFDIVTVSHLGIEHFANVTGL